MATLTILTRDGFGMMHGDSSLPSAFATRETQVAGSSQLWSRRHRPLPLSVLRVGAHDTCLENLVRVQ